MIVNERIRTYINSLDTGSTALLEDLEQEALEDRVPIIRKETQTFIKMYLASKRPRKILEVGTAVGFSTLLMCEYGPEDLQITTIENYEKRIEKAKLNFEKSGHKEKITFLNGDAGAILKTMHEKYDLIFLDAAKAQYIHWLPDLLRLLENQGTLLSDNVLQDGDLIESKYLVERRNRTIYKRMREYLYEITHARELVTSILPIGDGLAVSIKQEIKNEET